MNRRSLWLLLLSFVLVVASLSKIVVEWIRLRVDEVIGAARGLRSRIENVRIFGLLRTPGRGRWRSHHMARRVLLSLSTELELLLNLKLVLLILLRIVLILHSQVHLSRTLLQLLKLFVLHRHRQHFGLILLHLHLLNHLTPLIDLRFHRAFLSFLLNVFLDHIKTALLLLARILGGILSLLIHIGGRQMLIIFDELFFGFFHHISAPNRLSPHQRLVLFWLDLVLEF